MVTTDSHSRIITYSVYTRVIALNTPDATLCPLVISTKSLFTGRIRHDKASPKFGSRDYWRLCKRVLNKSSQFLLPSANLNGYYLLLIILFIFYFQFVKSTFFPSIHFEVRFYLMICILCIISSMISNLDPHRARRLNGIHAATALTKYASELDAVFFYTSFLMLLSFVIVGYLLLFLRILENRLILRTVKLLDF